MTIFAADNCSKESVGPFSDKYSGEATRKRRIVKAAIDQFLPFRPTVFYSEIEILVDEIDIAVFQHEIDGNGGCSGLKAMTIDEVFSSET